MALSTWRDLWNGPRADLASERATFLAHAMAREIVNQWLTSSTSGSKSYRTVLWSTGEITCDCPGWTFKRPGKQRGCKHTLHVMSGGVVAEKIKLDSPGKMLWSKTVIYAAPPVEPEPRPQAPDVQPRVIRGKRDIRL